MAAETRCSPPPPFNIYECSKKPLEVDVASR